MLLEKTTRMNFLFDFYQALLTDKQRSYMELYYLDDLLLGEIAESYKFHAKLFTIIFAEQRRCLKNMKKN